MKKIALVLLALMIMLSVAACGGKKEAEKKVEKKAEATATAKAEEVKLVYWSMWNPTEPQALAIKDAIDDFMAKNPGVKVDINWNGREIRKTLQPALDNGEVIDIWDEDLERVTKNWSKYAITMDDYVAKAWEGTDAKPYQDVVLGSLLNLGRHFAEDGKLHAVPYQPFAFIFLYNKDHFDKAGIKSVPKTWAEFLDVCAKLKAAGFTPLTTDDAYVDTLIGYHLAHYKGTQWVEQLVKDKSNKLWDDPAVLNMAQDFKHLVDKGYVSANVISNKWPAGQQEVALGDVSMYLNGTWLPNEIMGTTGPDFRWGSFGYPSLKGGVDGPEAANFGAQAFQINKNTKNKDMAFKLLVHLTTGKWDNEIAKKSFGVPVGVNAEWPVQLAEAKAVFNALEKAYPWAAGIQADPDKLPVIASEFTKLLGGKITAEEFVAAMKK